jgi:hypothetical protein
MRPDHSIRNIDIFIDFLLGNTLGVIGTIHNLSRERVRQIIAKSIIRLLKINYDQLKSPRKVYRTEDNMKLALEWKQFLLNEGCK